ncbi:RecX family transcriptional regulator [candidate division KSB1 bacterium]|nr:RecX family transcriptional regulator [candidate division KSB1 bacterium]
MSRRVTAITGQKRRSDRYSVFLDNEFAFSLFADVLLQSGIAVGDELKEEQIEELERLDERRLAKEKAIRLLAVRARSRSELEERLTRAGYGSAARVWAMQELERLGLINDLEFAIQFAKTRMVTRPQGRFLMKNELARKGVPEAFIDRALYEAYRETSEQEFARQVAQKRLRILGKDDSPKTKKKIFDLLARRGFSWEIIQNLGDNWQQLLDEIE